MAEPNLIKRVVNTRMYILKLNFITWEYHHP